MAVLAALPLLGVLTGLPGDEAAAEKPHERLRRRKNQRRRKQRTRRQQQRRQDGNGNANKGNNQGECCAPNCTGRQCGADGCGGDGVCGRCPSGSVCDESTGRCSCGPENCDGCCDENDVRQAGKTQQACGAGGVICTPCGSHQCCSTETGACRDNPPCSAETCPDGCCFQQANGFHVCRTDLRGCAPGGACCAGCCDQHGECQAGTDHGVCGKNGSTRIICNPLDPLCDDGRCQCDANNCPGCCSDGPNNPGFCQQGNTDAIRGSGGAQCVACPTGTTCDAQGHCQCLNTGQSCGAGTTCIACPEGLGRNAQGQCAALTLPAARTGHEPGHAGLMRR